MNKHNIAILAAIHANIPAGLKGRDLAEAKRTNVVTNGGPAAVEAAADLVRKGIDTNWLCPMGKLIGIETMAKVADLLDNKADLAELQKFAPDQILAGLDIEQLAGILPAPVVEPTIEAPVAEVVVAAETKTAPAVEVKKFPCFNSGRKATADELRIPPLGVLKALLKKSLLSEQDLIENASLEPFTRWKAEEFSLANGLQTLRNAQARHEANQAIKAEFKAFAWDLPRGEVREFHGVPHIKCGQCNTVDATSQFHFPLIDQMVANNHLMVPDQDIDGKPVLKSDGRPVYVVKLDRQGQPICIVPDLSRALKKFACCIDCANRMLDPAAAMDYETAVKVVSAAKAESDAERAAYKAKWERTQKQNQARSNRTGGFSMDSRDDHAGRQELQNWNSAARRERGSRNERNRASNELADDFANN